MGGPDAVEHQYVKVGKAAARSRQQRDAGSSVVICPEWNQVHSAWLWHPLELYVQGPLPMFQVLIGQPGMDNLKPDRC